MRQAVVAARVMTTTALAAAAAEVGARVAVPRLQEGVQHKETLAEATVLKTVRRIPVALAVERAL